MEVVSSGWIDGSAPTTSHHGPGLFTGDFGVGQFVDLHLEVWRKRMGKDQGDRHLQDARPHGIRICLPDVVQKR